ncbi:MAG: 16S rRNA (guanine(527)-N(7))-methyltransferase RsmG [Granulosicoccaceae bacterium]|jgi:16S rRNA (guanine527-N7)-methyltransferase
MSLSDSLQDGLAQLGCALGAAQQQQLLEYLALLDKWNRAYNLTAVRVPADMVPQHLLDSLSIRPYLYGEHVLDVGTGAGLPGIPLAVAEPDRQFVLLDSNGKKTRFVLQAAATLGLHNVEVVHGRIEGYEAAQPFDTIMSRAFATLADFINGCAHLLAPHGHLLAMKGKHPADELAQLPGGWQCMAEHELAVPGIAAERRVLEIFRI